MLSAGIALVLLFAITIFLNGAYRRTRLSRAEARYDEGIAFAAQGRNAEAAEDFRAALLYEHDNPRYRFALAQALVALKRWNEAENYLLELRAADPTSGPVNLMLAHIAAADGRDEEAIDDYHRAIFGYWPDHQEENRTKTRLELIAVLDRDHQQKQALAELLQLADEVPDSDVAMRRKVAAMMLAHGSPQHAAELYHAIVATHPRDAAAQQGLGEAEFAMNNLAAAQRAFHAAVRYANITPALAQRIAVINSVLDLDPTLLRLTARQRFDRAHELLGRALAAAGRCSAVPADLVNAAQTALASTRRQRDGETAEMLAVTQSIWKARLAGCSQLPIVDQPLAIVMAKMPNQ